VQAKLNLIFFTRLILSLYPWLGEHLLVTFCPTSTRIIVHIQCWIHDLLLFPSFFRCFPKISPDILIFSYTQRHLLFFCLMNKHFLGTLVCFLYTLHVQWIPSFPFTCLCSSFLNFSLILCVNFLYVHILC
jgi:hypothetical protein